MFVYDSYGKGDTIAVSFEKGAHLCYLKHLR